MELFEGNNTPEDETPTILEEVQEKPGRIRGRERRKLWRESRKQKRQAQKDEYQYAPLPVKIWALYLRWPVTLLAAIAFVAYVLYPAVIDMITVTMEEGMMAAYDARNEPVDKEIIYEMSPLDEEGAARIAAIDPVDPNDTWTICVYMVGSNLEDMGENDLSTLTTLETRDIKAQNEANMMARRLEVLSAFSADVNAGGVGMPEFLYYPKKPTPSDGEEPTTGPTIAEREGLASSDIREMTAGVWSDNISIVIQTGGATRWSNQRVNPNRTQRFLYQGGTFSEVADLPLQPCSETETLAEFLAFCRDNYPADHTMLVLWNHGGGPFGYGNDSIFSGEFSLADIREALSSVYEPNLADPAFDIIGFDACLMSCLDVTHALDGFASYYALSEESIPGDGWDYTPWLQAMTDDATMSPAAVCQAIADSYTDAYMTQNANAGFLVTQDVTFAVLDASKASELYDAYCELARAQLVDATQDLSVLSAVGRYARRSTNYGGGDHDVFNTVDLGNYVDLMVDLYPEQCSKIKDLLGQTVLYHRENGALVDSQGISVYVPGTIQNTGGLAYALDYVNNICDDDATRALYYYKLAGMLNDEQLQYVSTLTDQTPMKLDVAPLKEFGKETPQQTETGFFIPVSDEMTEMMQDDMFEFGVVDAEAGTIVYFGRDEYSELTSEGGISVDFDGEWICLDDVPLAVEVMFSTASSIGYRSRVEVDGEAKYLMFSYDRDTELFEIAGIQDVNSGSMNDEDVDTFNLLNNTRNVQTIEPGTYIAPIYTVYNIAENSDSKMTGEEIKYTADSRIELRGLASGYYVATLVLSDLRGDEYYSPVMGFTVENGTVTDHAVDTTYRGTSW